MPWPCHHDFHDSKRRHTVVRSSFVRLLSDQASSQSFPHCCAHRRHSIPWCRQAGLCVVIHFILSALSSTHQDGASRHHPIFASLCPRRHHTIPTDTSLTPSAPHSFQTSHHLVLIPSARSPIVVKSPRGGTMYVSFLDSDLHHLIHLAPQIELYVCSECFYSMFSPLFSTTLPSQLVASSATSLSPNLPPIIPPSLTHLSRIPPSHRLKLDRSASSYQSLEVHIATSHLQELCTSHSSPRFCLS
jgi:hypothetical protein